MNQSILFNDDLAFDKATNAWKMTGLMSGELLVIYYYSAKLTQTTAVDSGIRFDLEEAIEVWLENNEPENGEIHIYD